jgi:hypothetical protein
MRLQIWAHIFLFVKTAMTLGIDSELDLHCIMLQHKDSHSNHVLLNIAVCYGGPHLHVHAQDLCHPLAARTQHPPVNAQDVSRGRGQQPRGRGQ